MKIDKKDVNKKAVIRVYFDQCAYFGITPKETESISAHELYEICQNDYMQQPKSTRKKYLMRVTGQDGFWTRLRKRFFKVKL